MKIKRIVTFTLSIIFFYTIVYSQVPASLEKEIDVFYTDMLNAYKILKNEDIRTAVNKVSSLRPSLVRRSEDISRKIFDLQLNEEQYLQFGKKLLEKSYMKEYMSLFQDEILAGRIISSPEIKKEVDALEKIFDEVDGEDEGLSGQGNAKLLDFCSFTVEGNVPYKGTYQVKAEYNNATAHTDDNGLFTVEIRGKSGSLDMTIILMFEKAGTGKYEWSMESQCYIEGTIEEEEPTLLMTSYYSEGFVQLDKLGNTGESVNGKFSGKFFDDTGHTEKPVTVNGNFRAIKIRDAY